ncbi:hypothetical protein Vafri_9420 [Volvox africanus]|uniref:PPM-type phosphatase domain-containing protein n=1 Tax=Volvox africanus TaxID=51714 RepID=A0A8J4B479_9CHLO|nr:hypothetical protein Vafri_9420 [Volvox africanus]
MSQQRLNDSQSSGGFGQPLASAFVVPHPTRPNEDTFCICPLWFGGLGLVSFFGVYDGHSGQVVSRFLASSLHHYVEAYGMIATDVASALCQAFQTADAALAEATLNCPDAGSTATVALLSANNIIAAHCGDSRALICRGGHVMALTEDHRPARVDERERVLKSGGQILWNEGERVMGILQTTRAFGDRDLKHFGVIAEPEVAILSRTPEDEFLILATDGVFNVLSNEEVADVARRVLRRAMERGASRSAAIQMAASAIGRFSRDRNSKDDITVVLVDLAPLGPPCPPVSPQAASVADLIRSKTALVTHQQQHVLMQPEQGLERQTEQADSQQQQQQHIHHRHQQNCPVSEITSGASAAAAAGPGPQSPGQINECPWNDFGFEVQAPSAAQLHHASTAKTQTTGGVVLATPTAQACRQSRMSTSNNSSAAASTCQNGAGTSGLWRLDVGPFCHRPGLPLGPITTATRATAS